MSQVIPPIGKRLHLEAREAVLEAVTALDSDLGVTIPEINAYLGDRATVLTHWHLLILGDEGKVEWVRHEGDQASIHVRLRRTS